MIKLDLDETKIDEILEELKTCSLEDQAQGIQILVLMGIAHQLERIANSLEKEQK